MPDPISHAEMIAWCRNDIAWKRGHGWPDDEIEMQSALLAHLERTHSTPIDTAPRDGGDVVLDLGHIRASAFWCNDLQRWVLCRPLRMESVHEPKGWFPPSPETP